MIKAIIFDCFGVLTTDGWLPFKRKHFGHDSELAGSATELNKLTDTGLASYDDFVSAIAGLANMTPAEVMDAIERNVADDELFDYIATDLKPRYKIGMLSNAGGNWFKRLFAPEQIELFDAVALSYEMGFVKPDPRAYQVICDRLDVEPEECIFIDDLERYCTAAREFGMQAIWYKDFTQFKGELAGLLGKEQ